jgi:GNAT superfamily N-acetyltransferase
MQADLRIRNAHPADWPALLELFRNEYPEHGLNEQLLNWQYNRSPTGKAMVAVAVESKRLVACYAAVPTPLRLTGQAKPQTRIAWRFQDAVTHPDYRGQGLMHRLMEHIMEQLPVGFLGIAFPNPHSRRSLLRYDWCEAFTLPQWQVLARDMYSQPDTLVSPPSVYSPQIQLDATPRYQHYRFAERPLAHYDVKHRFLPNGQVFSCAVKHYRPEVKNIVLCQPLVLPAFEHVLTDLKQTWHPNTQLTLWSTHPGVEQLGFQRDTTYERSLLVTAPPGELEWMKEPANWHLDSLLSDVF